MYTIVLTLIEVKIFFGQDAFWPFICPCASMEFCYFHYPGKLLKSMTSSVRPYCYFGYFRADAIAATLTLYVRFRLVILNKLGDNCIQNFHLGSYIVGYTVGNLVLQRRTSGAVKLNFRLHIRRYTSLNEILNMVIPILMHFCSFLSN